MDASLEQEFSLSCSLPLEHSLAHNRSSVSMHWMNKWGLSGPAFFRTWVNMKSVWRGPGIKVTSLPLSRLLSWDNNAFFQDNGPLCFPTVPLDKFLKCWDLGSPGPWQCTLPSGFLFSHSWLEKEINRNLSIGAMSWFLTFAGCGFMLALNKTRGQLRFTLCNQESFTWFHPAN